MIRRLVHIMVALGLVLLCVGGWLVATSSPPEATTSPTQQPPHTTSSPPTPTPASTSEAPTTPSTREPTTNSSPKPPKSPTSTNKTSTSTTTPSQQSLPAERARAVKTARAFLSDLTARERDRKEWWRAVKPYLIPQARMDMSDMEPKWVPPLELKPGGGVVVDEDAPVDAHQREVEVAVPSESGWVEVVLRPTPGGDEYLVVRYDLPKGQ